MTEKRPLLTHDAISDAMLETKGFFPGLLFVRLFPFKLRSKPKYGEKRFRAKIDLWYIKGKLQNDTLKGYKFSLFSPTSTRQLPKPLSVRLRLPVGKGSV